MTGQYVYYMNIYADTNTALQPECWSILPFMWLDRYSTIKGGLSVIWQQI